jgi:hypothetical protein
MNFDEDVRHRRKRESHTCKSRKTKVQYAVATGKDCQNDGNSVDDTQHLSFQLNVSDYILLNHTKRRRKGLQSCEKCKKSVTFATENAFLDGYLPYKSGLTDAEVITRYRDDIWYNVSLIPVFSNIMHQCLASTLSVSS